MAFTPELSSWWMRVGNYKCKYFWYKEDISLNEGWKVCGRGAKEVHHIIGSAWLIEQGHEPNDAVGLPLCRYHHRLSLNLNPDGSESLIHNRNFSFHPDAALALEQYKAYIQRANDLGNKNEDEDPFHVMMRCHIEDSKRGIRYWASPQEVDDFYIMWMSTLATRYTLLHPEDQKPSYQRRYPLPRFRHWTDEYFGFKG